MTPLKITIVNRFHNTSASVVVRHDFAILSRNQMERATKALCGMADCVCGGWGVAVDQHGHAYWTETIQDDGFETVRFYRQNPKENPK